MLLLLLLNNFILLSSILFKWQLITSINNVTIKRRKAKPQNIPPTFHPSFQETRLTGEEDDDDDDKLLSIATGLSTTTGSKKSCNIAGTMMMMMMTTTAECGGLSGTRSLRLECRIEEANKER